MSFSAALDRLFRRRRQTVRGVRWRMRRRSDWALAILLLLGLLVLAALLLTQVWAPFSGALVGGQPDAPLLTARAARDAAAPVAQQWAGDASLLRASATWDRARDYEPGSAEWTLLYYSSRRDETALFAVADNRATLTQERPAEQPLAAQADSSWQVDSPAAVEQLLRQGGQAFLRQHPEALLTLTLTLEAPAGWRAVLIDRETRQTFLVEVNAQDGQVVAIEQSQ